MTLDFGPRVIGFRRVGGENVLYVKPETRGTIGGEAYVGYGGHRLWTAPEVRERTCEPDNQPVRLDGDWFETTGSAVGLAKALRLIPTQSGFAIHHRVRNDSDQAHEIALWPITVMRAGGVCRVRVAPAKPHGQQLLPRFPMVLWAYTHWSDPRIVVGQDSVELHQHAEGEPTKIGVWSSIGEAEYVLPGERFIKHFPATPGNYPDFGCNFEAYTRHDMLEVESLSPLTTLAPGESATHIEQWTLLAEKTEDA